MSKDIRIIGLDIDGTILNEDKQMPYEVRRAIEKALRAGVIVLPATGRPLRNIPEEVLGIQGIRYALTANGASVYDLSTDTILYSDYFDKGTALSVLEAAQQFPSLITLLIAGQGYADRKSIDAIIGGLPPEMEQYLRNFRKPVDDIKKMLIESKEPLEKFSIHYPSREVRSQAKELFLARKDVYVTSSLPTNLELNTPTANKGTALLELGKILGFKREQIMAIGDSSNDLDMIQAVGYGVAMGNAEPGVKAVADAVTLSCEENGVAHAIESVLIRS